MISCDEPSKPELICRKYSNLCSVNRKILISLVGVETESEVRIRNPYSATLPYPYEVMTEGKF